MRRLPAFTLVELLVVITIIVILLSLLAPAMDKAIYQAELAVCGASLNAVGKGATAYATEHKRMYPYRPSMADGERSIYIGRGGNWTSDTARNTNLDDRFVFRSHIPLDALLCALDGKIDLSAEASRPKIWVYANYQVWFGWKFDGEDHALRRLGDRFSWGGDRFDVLAADQEEFRTDTNLMSSSHPDGDGVFWQNVVQDEDLVAPFNATHGGTYSFWGAVTTGRGQLDRNFVYADGSVERFDDLAWRLEGSTEITDDRMHKIEIYKTNNKPTIHTQLPR